MVQSPDFASVVKYATDVRRATWDEARHYRYLQARQELMLGVLKVIADNRLDAIVHKSIEHQPTLFKECVNLPLGEYEGRTHLNTFLVDVPVVAVPAGPG